MHPGQWTDDKFVTCSPLARLLALGLRNESDDNGIFEWNPVKLKMRLLPADNCDIESLLVELVSSQQIVQYEESGKKYGLIRNFRKYQRPKYPSYQYPIPEVLPEGFELKEPDSVSPTGKSKQRESRGEKRRKDICASGDARIVQTPSLTGFDRFWKAYPRKKSKGQARRTFAKLKPNEQLLETILASLERAKTSENWRKDGGKFIPYPATWLDAEGWEDEDVSTRRANPAQGAI